MNFRSCTVLIADDEPASRDYLELLFKKDTRFQVGKICDSGASAIDYTDRFQPDVLVLDIQMPFLDGFDVLESLSYAPIVVFVTAFDEHALRAYDFEVFDYVTKPIVPSRFRAMLDRIQQRFCERASRQILESSDYVLDDDEAGTKVLHTVAGDLFYKENTIRFIESDDNYIKVYIGDQAYKSRQTLGSFVAKLESPNLLRVHRSYVVNLKHVRKIDRYAGQTLLELRAGEKVPVSLSYRDQVLERLIKSSRID